jgi:predicted nucleotidyltransferase
MVVELESEVVEAIAETVDNGPHLSFHGVMLNAPVSISPRPAASPTVFPELNELLEDFLGRVESILESNFVGAYLTGSFALGAGDLHSDCDFLVVTEDRVTAEQERALRELHKEIPTRPGHWPHDLEGSYAPRTELMTLAALNEEWLYVDRGWREMQWSTHCNTEDMRWTLRERGITLAGPDPRELVHEVPPDALRSKMRQLIDNFLPDLFSWTSFESAWTQRYAVTNICRMLYTLDTGEVTSKPAALEWAKYTLPAAWKDLLQQVLDERARGWDPDDRPLSGSVQATIALLEYAKDRAANSFKYESSGLQVTDGLHRPLPLRAGDCRRPLGPC